MQEVLSLLRRAVEDYQMISEGDRIAVGVSGGKDSMLLLLSLISLQKFYPKKFDLVAITLDMQFGGCPADYSEVSAICDKAGIPYHIKLTEIGAIIFDIRKEQNPCSLCARMRRGVLHDTAKELGCNKLALGHHADDAVETFFLNLFEEGRLGCFSPVTYLSRKDLTMIRPLILLSEDTVISAVERLSIPVVKSKCPADNVTKRQEIKQLIKSLEGDYTSLRKKVIGAMQRASLSDWSPIEKRQSHTKDDTTI